MSQLDRTGVIGAWEEHRRACWHCQREWKRWEEGEMTCDRGVELFLAVQHADADELVLF